MSVPHQRLDGVLQQFYAELRKTNGENYEPESLKVMQAALDRYFCSYSILKDKDFIKSQMTLKGKAIDFQNKEKEKNQAG